MVRDKKHRRMFGGVSGRLAMVICLFLVVLIWVGCATIEGVQTIKVHRHLYKPDLPASLAVVYGGKHIDLNDFVNSDTKTRVWTYYSPDRKIAYEASVPLEYYVMDCFRDAFWKLGVSVLKFSPEKNVPDMALIIDHWSDQEFKFTVTLMKDGIEKYKNQFSIMVPSVQDQADLVQREKNAYGMMNKAIVAVLSDPDFQAAF